MSAEPATAMAAATEPSPVAEEAKVEASSAPTQIQPTPAVEPTEEERETGRAGTPLSKLFAELPTIVKDAEYTEIWGVELKDENDVPSGVVLEKFLRANNKDVGKAKDQLIEALKWRKTAQPAKLLADTEFDAAKFGGLGYVTVYSKTASHGKEIVTWNLYGAVQDNKETFGDVDA